MTALTRNALNILIPGTTHILERNGEEAFVYLAKDGSGYMRLEDGETRSGTWRMLDDGYATHWNTGQRGEWQLLETDDGLDYVSRDGQQRLKMLGLRFGDSEKLADYGSARA